MTEPVHPIDPSRPLVLVIDDEDDLRNLLTHALRSAGFSVISAPTAGEGLALAVLHRPLVVTLDRMLPGTDGLEICRHLREDPELAGLAIMVVSARGGTSDRSAGAMAGVDEYVVKPFGVADLVARVEKLAETALARRPARSGLRLREK